jgi:hypothetical protein
MNSGDAAHIFVQGSETGGFWTSESGGTTLLGLLRCFGTPPGLGEVGHERNVPTQS